MSKKRDKVQAVGSRDGQQTQVRLSHALIEPHFRHMSKRSHQHESTYRTRPVDAEMTSSDNEFKLARRNTITDFFFI